MHATYSHMHFDHYFGGIQSLLRETKMLKSVIFYLYFPMVKLCSLMFIFPFSIRLRNNECEFGISKARKVIVTYSKQIIIMKNYDCQTLIPIPIHSLFLVADCRCMFSFWMEAACNSFTTKRSSRIRSNPGSSSIVQNSKQCYLLCLQSYFFIHLPRKSRFHSRFDDHDV